MDGSRLISPYRSRTSSVLPTMIPGVPKPSVAIGATRRAVADEEG